MNLPVCNLMSLAISGHRNARFHKQLVRMCTHKRSEEEENCAHMCAANEGAWCGRPQLSRTGVLLRSGIYCKLLFEDL